MPQANPPIIHAILLAAGSSVRMGSRNKLLTELDRKPIIRHSAESLLASNVTGLTVVTGPDAPAIGAALDGLALNFIGCADNIYGVGHSIAAGVASLPDALDAILIALADMPLIDSRLIDRAIARYDRQCPAQIIVPQRGARYGHPVIFSANFRQSLASLSGDTGAKSIIRAHPDLVCRVAANAGAFIDIDTLRHLKQVRRYIRKQVERKIEIHDH